MGLLEKNAGKAHDRQRESLVEEATEAGGRLVAFEEAGVGGGKGVLSGALKSIVGGRMSVDHVQTLTFETKGRTHVFFQPYAGVAAMPGEHFAILDGALPAAVAFESGIFSNSWSAPADKAVAKALDANANLKRVAKKSKFEWALGMGKIELEWAIQIAGLGDGRSLVVLQTGRYGGFTTYKVGFAHFAALLDAITPVLDTSSRARHAPVHPCAYEPLFRAVVLGEVAEEAAPEVAEVAPEAPAATAAEAPAPRPSGATRDYADVIRGAVTPHAGKKIHVSELPAKKDKNIRSVVLPSGAQDVDIVAAFDLTMFGSGKDAVVFTATHCYAHEMDERAAFALSDLEAVDGWDGALQSNVVVRIRGVGEVKVPASGEDALVDTLRAIASANG